MEVKNKNMNEELKDSLLDQIEQLDGKLYELSNKIEENDKMSNEEWQEHEDILNKIYSILDDIKLDVTHS